SINQTVIPALFNPTVQYLPTVKKTIVLGGGNYYDKLLGRVTVIAPFDTAYLISKGETSSQQDHPAISIIKLANTPPLPRYQSCEVVLPDGRLFIHGGRDFNTTLADAWILDPKDWSWQQVTIHVPSQGKTSELRRTGHSCALGVNGQIVVVGG